MNIPDYVFQLQEIERQLLVQADMTAAVWKDDVKKRFYEQHVEQYSHIIQLVINGDHHGDFGIYKRGLNEMLEGISDCFNQMAGASGTSAEELFNRAMNGMHDGSLQDHYNQNVDVENYNKVRDRGIVYDENLERDYWSPTFNGPRPGTMGSEDREEIMKRRSHGW